VTVLAPPQPGARRRDGRALQVALFGIPLVLLLAGAWSRRWTADDGFINLRIVEQLWAGNGPVWNATERVETGTSPLWLAVLAAAGAVLRFMALEWVSVGLGIAATVGGLAAAVAAARVLHGRADRLLVPVGALAVAALPPFWDFASSGLETGLSFLWLGLSGWALAVAATGSGAGRRPVATAVLLGLGPLVRPDLALISGALLLALLACTSGGWRRRGALVLAAGALPVGYQLFRMAYFATVVPNTALAKEGTTSRWDEGWRYAGDFAGSWRLWWPAAVVAVVAVPAVRRWTAGGGRDRLVVTTALTVGAALHAVYVVRVGGDFMHARLLLPATFAALVPWAVVPLRRAGAVAAVAMVGWAVLAATTWSPPALPEPGEVVTGVLDERAYYVHLAGRPNPVTAGDFDRVPYAAAGRRAAASADAGRGSLTLRTFEPDVPATWSPLRRPGAPFAVSVDNVGVFGFLAGPDVTVIDRRGLGDPVTSRFRLEGERGRPGHEKTASDEWVVGRHGAPGAPALADLDPSAVAAVRQATSCGQLADVLDGISEPLTPARAWDNVGLALRSYQLRVSSDPDSARAELCS
jgi:arabinofuranosyltransferase